jgi:hypothetical protein
MKCRILRTSSRLSCLIMMILTIRLLFTFDLVYGAQLRAGVAKANITDLKEGNRINDSLFAKALVLDNGSIRAVIITVDAIGTGYFLDNVRFQLREQLNIKPENVLINASHLHGRGPSYSDIEKPIVKAVKEAIKNMVPVNVGVGKGYEERIMENRRIKLKNGKEWTIRHANPLPPDEEVAGIGPVDPEIGILRLDRKDGRTLAVVYNFACHPYQRVPNRGTTADFPGFASRVIEDNIGNGALALFLQGCGGNITTVLYKDVNNPRDAEPLGNMLGLSTLQALKKIECKGSAELKVIHEIIDLPRRTDIPQRIDSLQTEQAKLLQSLRGTSLNIKTFIPLYIKYSLSPEYPSYYSHRYLHDKMIGRNDLENLDDENRRNMAKYLRNIYAMEKLARIQENISILKERQAEKEAAGGKTLKAEVHGIRIGDFVLVTFPGEAVVEIGLDIKKMSQHKFTFVAGYTNENGTKGQPPMEEGNIWYAPTSDQFKGEAYEDTYTAVAPEWQKIYEDKVMEILKKL